MADAGLAYVSAIRITNSASTGSLDGYDVDGVEAINGCSNEPVIEGQEPPVAVEAQSAITSYPNPTTGPSEVVFSTAATGRTYIDVYDMNGRKVATLFDQVAQEGQDYSLNFNGLSLPNGFYVYVLTNNNETTIERFLIAK